MTPKIARFRAATAGNAVPVLDVVQEIFGVNNTMRAAAARVADPGSIAVCPDLFSRRRPGVVLTDKTKEEWNRAFELIKS